MVDFGRPPQRKIRLNRGMTFMPHSCPEPCPEGFSLFLKGKMEIRGMGHEKSPKLRVEKFLKYNILT
jgi:hypothetical protein